MNLKGLELFSITKSDTVMGSVLDLKLYTERQMALYQANERAIAIAKDMRAADEVDMTVGDRIWTVEHDDDGASVFVDDEVAFRLEVNLMIVE